MPAETEEHVDRAHGVLVGEGTLRRLGDALVERLPAT
jgi:hypothetical protein